MNVSVLLSIYNLTCSKELLKCYQSIEAQKIQSVEVVTVIDGPISKDLEEVANKHSDKFVRLEQNKGLGIALNYGLRYCSNEYIARIDCDDVMLECRLLAQSRYLDDNPDVDVVAGLAFTTDIIGRKTLRKLQKKMGRYC